MTFNEIWEILLCQENIDTPEDIEEYRLRALISLIKDEKRLEKTSDRFVKTLKVRGAIPMLRQMFGVKPNEPTTTTGPTKKPISAFEKASRDIFK